MEKIADTIHSVMHDLESKKSQTRQDDPQVLLKKTLTKRELNHIKFKYLKNGVLCIAIDSSTWLYQLNLKKALLLERLRMKSDNIKDIRMRLGSVK